MLHYFEIFRFGTTTCFYLLNLKVSAWTTAVKIFVSATSAVFCYRRSTWKVSLPIATIAKLEDTYVLHDMVGDEKVPTEALSTHVRCFVPLAVEEYIYMVEEEKAPKISTMKATLRMPIYDRVNGLLEQNHCLPFMTYMFTNQSLFRKQRYLLHGGGLHFPAYPTCAGGSTAHVLIW